MFDFIIGVVDATGYLGVGFLMLLENVFPPIPSELIMPLAGYSAAQGNLSLIGVILSGSLGSLLGTSVWYWAGLKLGRQRLERFARRHGRWLTFDESDIAQATDSFRRHGAAAVFFGRLLPTIRTLISIPAGISDMSKLRFLLFTSLGTVLWTAALTIAGYLLGQRFKQVSDWMNPVSTVIVVVLVLWYGYRVASYKPAGAR